MWQWRYQPHKGGSHVKELPEAAATNSAYNAAECNLRLCKGPQLADNKANVQKSTAGDPGYADLDSNSDTGTANVSVVDTKTDRVIGDPLISFTGYADQSLPTLPKNNHKFQHCDSKGVGEALRSRRTMCTFISALTSSREQKTKGILVEFSPLIAKITADSLLSAGFAMVLVWRSCKADVRVLRRFYD